MFGDSGDTGETRDALSVQTVDTFLKHLLLSYLFIFSNYTLSFSVKRLFSFLFENVLSL